MSFNSPAVLSALQTLVTAISGMQEVHLGVPESLGHALAAYITLGGGPIVPIAFGSDQRIGSATVTLAYRVEDAESTAELALAAAVDALETAILADPTLGGACLNARLDTSGANGPEYEPAAGLEYRRYPARVLFEQWRP